LAYPINKRTNGIYFTVEFANETGAFVDDVELALRRDERIMRFLTVKLDKFGVKYNEDKRAGKIGEYTRKKKAEYAKRREEEKKKKAERRGKRGRRN
jgi:small subunit ribosomal protein S6